MYVAGSTNATGSGSLVYGSLCCGSCSCRHIGRVDELLVGIDVAKSCIADESVLVESVAVDVLSYLW